MADAAVSYLRASLAGTDAIEIDAVPGSEIDAARVRRADALIVRSVTRVDEALVAGSSLRFVGSATAGIDHVDVDALRRHGIAFAHAPGCNANAVVHYVLAALYRLATHHDASLRARPVGVVGYGQVGSRLTARLRALGWTVLVSDPPLAAAGDDRERFVALDELLHACGVVSLHVPLTRPGESRWPTQHLLDAARVGDALSGGVCLIQTSRGGVLDEHGLLASAGARGRVVLDVFEGEPALRWTLLERHQPVLLATPHVAGYSPEGKREATRMVLRQMADAFGLALRPLPVDADRPEPRGVDPSLPPERALAQVLITTRGLLEDDRALRALLSLPAHARPSAFERLRASYALRPEPPAWRIETDDPRLRGLLDAVGFSRAD